MTENTLPILKNMSNSNPSYNSHLLTNSETADDNSRRIYLEFEARRKRESRKRLKQKEKENIPPKENKRRQLLSERRLQELSKELDESFNHIVRNVSEDLDKGRVLQRLFKKNKHLPMQADVADPREAAVMKTMIVNVRDTFQSQKMQRTTDVLQARKSTLQMAASSTRGINQSAISRVLSVPRKSIAMAFRRRICAEYEAGPWSIFGRKKRSDAFSPEEIAIVRKFWDENTRVSPYKKHVRKLLTESGEKIDHPIHLLEMTQVQLYLAFKKEYPDIKMSQQAFEKMKPSYVRKLQERETCCCQYHLHLEFARQAINNMRIDLYGVHKDCNCKCKVCGPGPICMAKENTIKSSSDYWRMVLCPKDENDEWHKHTCLMQTCTKCGVKKLPRCPKEWSKKNIVNVNWKVFEKQEVQRKNTLKYSKKPAKVTRLAYKSGSPFEFNEHATKTMKSFVPHNYRAHWQAKEFKKCLSTIQDDTIVSVIDFAENYGFKIQQEAQSCHWHTDQVSILVHITYRRLKREEVERKNVEEEISCKKKDSAKEKRKQSLKGIVKETHFYISDDKTHDTEFVQHCLQLHADWLQSNGVEYNKHVFWSDGCSSQFKSSRPFQFLGRFSGKMDKDILWNFFASSHGKGEHDGAGAVVKRILTQEQMKYDGWKLQCAKEVVAFLKWYFQNHQTDNDIRRHFWEIESSKIDRSERFDCHTLKGTTKLHCIRPCDKGNPLKVAHRTLSCFCNYCLQFKWDQCINLSRIGDWEHCELKMKGCKNIGDGNVLQEVEEEEEGEDDVEEEEEGEDDVMSSMIEVGDNFAVNAEEGNEEGVDFYILRCTEPKTTLLENYKDGWGNVFGVEEVIVTGHYYKQMDGGLKFQLLQEKPVASVYSHLVRLSKFDMIADANDQTLYVMAEDTCQQIMSSLPPAS